MAEEISLSVAFQSDKENTNITIGTAYAIPTMGPEGCASWRWAAKATELNRHTTRMKIRASVVS